MLHKYTIDEIYDDWLYRERKYDDKDLFIVEEALKCNRDKHLFDCDWYLMFFYNDCGDNDLSFEYALRFYDRMKWNYSHNMQFKNAYISACEWLGDHYCRGQGATIDYEKAYKYYMNALALDENDTYALERLACMYKYGYYVKKDLKKYFEISKNLYDNGIFHDNETNEAFENQKVEIYQHYADYLFHIGNKEKAVEILKEAKLASIEYLHDVADNTGFRRMKEIVRNIYGTKSLKQELNKKRIILCISDLYNLYQFNFDICCRINFVYKKKLHEINILKYKNDYFYLNFQNKNYKNLTDLIFHGTIETIEIRQLINQINNIEILY